MSNTKSKRHTHKYQKIDIAGNKVWSCSLPNCMHYLPKHMERLVEGKNTFCWNCDKEFPLNDKALLMDRPWCYECLHDEVKGIESEDLDLFVKSLKEGK